jgi:hypothetical protein
VSFFPQLGAGNIRPDPPDNINVIFMSDLAQTPKGHTAIVGNTLCASDAQEAQRKRRCAWGEEVNL